VNCGERCAIKNKNNLNNLHPEQALFKSDSSFCGETPLSATVDGTAPARPIVALSRFPDDLYAERKTEKDGVALEIL
jgi:hypothetical protein